MGRASALPVLKGEKKMSLEGKITDELLEKLQTQAKNRGFDEKEEALLGITTALVLINNNLCELITQVKIIKETGQNGFFEFMKEQRK